MKEATILEDPFHFHPLAIEDCLSEVHHPKVDDYEAYIFAILHGIRFDAPTDSFITRELDIFLGPELPDHPPQRAHAVDHHDPRPVQQEPAGGDAARRGLPAARDPRPDVRALLPEPRRHRGQDPDGAGGGVRGPEPRDPGPDLRPQEGRHAAAAHLPAPARDHQPPGPRRLQGHQRPRRRLLPRHLRQPVPHRGRVDVLPGHDPEHDGRLPLRGQQSAERDHEAPDHHQRAAHAPDRHHRHLRHELRLHAGAALEVRLLPRARGDGAGFRRCSSCASSARNGCEPDPAPGRRPREQDRRRRGGRAAGLRHQGAAGERARRRGHRGVHRDRGRGQDASSA